MLKIDKRIRKGSFLDNAIQLTGAIITGLVIGQVLIIAYGIGYVGK